MNSIDMLTFGVIFVLIVVAASAVYSAICALAKYYSQKEEYIKYDYYNKSSDELKEEHIKLVNSVAKS